MLTRSGVQSRPGGFQRNHLIRLKRELSAARLVRRHSVQKLVNLRRPFTGRLMVETRSGLIVNFSLRAAPEYIGNALIRLRGGGERLPSRGHGTRSQVPRHHVVSRYAAGLVRTGEVLAAAGRKRPQPAARIHLQGSRLADVLPTAKTVAKPAPKTARTGPATAKVLNHREWSAFLGRARQM